MQYNTMQYNAMQCNVCTKSVVRTEWSQSVIFSQTCTEVRQYVYGFECHGWTDKFSVVFSCQYVQMSRMDEQVSVISVFQFSRIQSSKSVRPYGGPSKKKKKTKKYVEYVRSNTNMDEQVSLFQFEILQFGRIQSNGISRRHGWTDSSRLIQFVSVQSHTVRSKPSVRRRSQPKKRFYKHKQKTDKHTDPIRGN
jgi:hypothetical protein